MGSALFGHARSNNDFTVADFPCRKSSYLWQIGGVCRQVVVFPTGLWLLAAVFTGCAFGDSSQGAVDVRYQDRACDGLSGDRERRCNATLDNRERDDHS